MLSKHEIEQCTERLRKHFPRSEWDQITYDLFSRELRTFDIEADQAMIVIDGERLRSRGQTPSISAVVGRLRDAHEQFARARNVEAPRELDGGDVITPETRRAIDSDERDIIRDLMTAPPDRLARARSSAESRMGQLGITKPREDDITRWPKLYRGMVWAAMDAERNGEIDLDYLNVSGAKPNPLPRKAHRP